MRWSCSRRILITNTITTLKSTTPTTPNTTHTAQQQHPWHTCHPACLPYPALCYWLCLCYWHHWLCLCDWLYLLPAARCCLPAATLASLVGRGWGVARGTGRARRASDTGRTGLTGHTRSTGWTKYHWCFNSYVPDVAMCSVTCGTGYTQLSTQLSGHRVTGQTRGTSDRRPSGGASGSMTGAAGQGLCWPHRSRRYWTSG